MKKLAIALMLLTSSAAFAGGTYKDQADGCILLAEHITTIVKAIRRADAIGRDGIEEVKQIAGNEATPLVNLARMLILQEIPNNKIGMRVYSGCID